MTLIKTASSILVVYQTYFIVCCTYVHVFDAYKFIKITFDNFHFKLYNTYNH